MKPSIPKGTRDFLPEQAAKRIYIFNTLKSVFESHGFLPVETPAMEKLETLTGKYGEEGDRLIFKILNRGDKLTKALNQENTSQKELAAEALRYDLTVPFARMVVQYQNDITFPFKRYQIQPVWRADRPQKGRYREFFQCDVDVIGSKSLNNEVELVQIMSTGFKALGLPDVTIKINNRKILLSMAKYVDAENSFVDFTVALDKIDKIGEEGVLKELVEKGFNESQSEKLKALIALKANAINYYAELKALMAISNIDLTGFNELDEVFAKTKLSGIENIEFDATLARGLNYYTGAIIEVTHPDFNSSICGGGRYDDLTGVFGLKDMSGVGVSFGADRIYDLLEDKGLYPDNIGSAAKVLFMNFGDKEVERCMEAAADLRANGISCEIYPDNAKMKKQFKYAEDKNIPYIVFIGETELESSLIKVKDQASGEQEELSVDEFIVQLNRN
mgnify:FL=1|jgi:histidyl-tRNA synthetase|tara:strand:+ start:182 stop:1522 length:1341 start_codon:yes stop_codon:yes gene_type:complete